MEEVIVIPASPLAFALDSSLDGLVLTQHGHRQAIEQRQVFDPVTVALTHAVLVEGHIQHPMQTVLDPPVLADRARQTLGPGRQAADEVSYLVAGLAADVI